MTRIEFEKILEIENIPREWVSLNELYKAPVSLSGKTLYYGKQGRLDFLYDVDYNTILEKLREYKAEQEFIQSNEIAQITNIEIASSERVVEYGNSFVVRRDSFADGMDKELLKQGFEYKDYDYYMAYSIYEKICGDEIFTGVVIRLNIKTQNFEREQYGFKDLVMDSGVTLPLPMKLRGKIIEYIKEKKTQIVSSEDDLFQEIINEYGFQNIIEEESKRIKFYNVAYKNILGYELERQKILRQYSEEKLLEVFRNIKMSNIFSNNISISSRPDCIEDLRLLEAKEILKELIEE